MLHKIGIDLGGTKTEGILLDENLTVIQRKRIPTPSKNYPEIIQSIKSLVLDLSKEIDEFTLGVCAPGAISKKTGLIKNSNTQSLIGKPLKQDLEKLLEKKIYLENDANCFVKAESLMGAGKDYSMVFGVIMGTGIGGGIMINGKLHRGRSNIAGEWGHHILHTNGIECYCGNRGCVETYISGPALEKKWFTLTGTHETVPMIIQSQNFPKLKLWKNEFIENFGLGIANVIDILDPDAIVLGGGLSNIDFLYTDGKNSVYQKVFSDIVDTPILKNHLGDSAGVFGAALLE